MPISDTRRFVVVPGDNPFNVNMPTKSMRQLSALSAAGLRAPGGSAQVALEDLGEIRVIDSVELGESTLVELTELQYRDFQRRFPSLRVEPEGRLELMLARPFRLSPAVRDVRTASTRSVIVEVVDEEGSPVTGCDVTAIYDRRAGEGVLDLRTDAQGRVELRVPMRYAALEEVIAAPIAKFWPASLRDAQVTEGTTLRLVVPELAPDERDALSTLLDRPPTGTGAGVRVAIIDAGSSLPEHPRLVGGGNFTGSEDAALVGDNGTGHGTHVAGIVARLAPEAELHIYRVCAEGSRAADEIPISKAIRHAVNAGCDLINLSLGQASEPITITREVRRARALGVVVVAAAGNDWGADVSWPARTPSVLAVTACGDADLLRDGTGADRNVANQPPARGNVFFAGFSNCGSAADLIAPGVAIISPVAADARGVMDGTSMASPAAVALIARALSADAALLNRLDRDQERSDDIVLLANRLAVPFGFGVQYEGVGLVRA